MTQRHGFVTNTIHAGGSGTTPAVPIHLGATTNARYMRSGNPTLDAFEENVKTLDGGGAAISTSCGMAAVSQTLLALLSPGDRIVCHNTVYHWTTYMMQNTLPKWGVDVDMVDLTDLDQMTTALSKPAAVVYFEPVANPKLEVIDSARAIQMAHEAGAKVVIDNTYLSPYLFKPLEHGADIVLHSATKYLCGHGDSLAGIVVTRDEALGQQIVTMRNTMGGILSPVNAYLLIRGIKTLSMRMDRHCANAQAVAEYLLDHPNVATVAYPGLPASQGHEIAKAQWRGFGGMVFFKIADATLHKQFLDGVRLCRPWVSLGDAGSLVSDRSENQVRMSVGLEDIEDILADLEQALDGA